MEILCEGKIFKVEPSSALNVLMLVEGSPKKSSNLGDCYYREGYEIGCLIGCDAVLPTPGFEDRFHLSYRSKIVTESPSVRNSLYNLFATGTHWEPEQEGSETEETKPETLVNIEGVIYPVSCVTKEAIHLAGPDGHRVAASLIEHTIPYKKGAVYGEFIGCKSASSHFKGPSCISFDKKITFLNTTASVKAKFGITGGKNAFEETGKVAPKVNGTVFEVNDVVHIKGDDPFGRCVFVENPDYSEEEVTCIWSNSKGGILSFHREIFRKDMLTKKVEE